ncbi:unnamed protein product [Rotaria sordida]|uniref:RAI1-like domain-containing protein n=1 Tax=Rotaria sordida TaxID=392033 RepID=A0A814WFP0_9BILA|nr:unnamed protein product [Rotaria sordida]CAF4048775.1 unnamed protein product [Rotaria sordida]
MASALRPKRKAKRSQNGLPNELFTRLQLIIALEDYPSELMDISPSLVDSYDPRILASCTLSWHLPKNPLSIADYRRCIIIPGQTPYFVQPIPPAYLPSGPQRNAHIRKPIHASILPLLLTAQHARVDIRQYDIISERNSIRKFLMNDEDYIISVVRIDSTVFLRRYATYNHVDRNDVGYRFEQMCTMKSGSFDGNYHQLIEGRIGELRILVLAETDAIKQENGESNELKCQQQRLAKSQEHD